MFLQQQLGYFSVLLAINYCFSRYVNTWSHIGILMGIHCHSIYYDCVISYVIT